MSTDPRLEQLTSSTQAHIQDLAACTQECERLHKSMKKSPFDSVKPQLAALCTRSGEAASLLRRDIEQLNALGPNTSKTTAAAHSCLSSLQKSMTRASEALQAKTYELFDQASLKPPANPKDFIEHAELLLTTIQIVPENRHYAHLCLEKAASLLAASGDYRRAFEIRRTITERMGLPPSFSIDLSRLPPEGIVFNGFDGGGVKRGELLLKQRAFKDEGQRLTLSMHTNAHLSTQLRDTIGAIQRDPSYLPSDLREKVSVAVVPNGYPGIIGEPQVFSSDLHRDGLVMGLALQLTVAGVGSITIAEDTKILSLAHRIEFNASLT